MSDDIFPPVHTEIADLKRAIEAVVLVAFDPVPPDLLAQLLEQPSALIEQCCAELAADYTEQGRGFELARVAGGYRYQTRRRPHAYVERFLLHDQRARLSGAALETLAIVAYKQPISRAQVASIRGVDPDGVIRTLVGPRLHRRGRARRGPGQAVLFGTTRCVPREAGPRLGRRPAADRRVHPRCRRRRGARARLAGDAVRRCPTTLSHRSGSNGKRPTASCPAVSGSRRCSPRSGGGVAGCARS